MSHGVYQYGENVLLLELAEYRMGFTPAPDFHGNLSLLFPVREILQTGFEPAITCLKGK